MELLRRIWYLLNRRRIERDLAEEMAVHREMMEAESRPAFGSMLRLREEARDVWGWAWLDALVQDLTYGARVLRRSPGFTLTAVAVLAIGIVVNLTAFQMFNLFVLRPLPVRDPATIVKLERRADGNVDNTVVFPAVRFYGEYNTVLSSVMAQAGREVQLGDGTGERLQARFVTANYFTELGSRAAYGRVFDAATEERPGAPATAILGHAFWQRRFGGDPAVVGRTIRLNGKPVVIAGVAPYDFTGLEPASTDVWIPMAQTPYLFEGSRLLEDFSATGVAMFGRLKPGVSPAAAENGLRPLVDELRKQHPEYVWEGEWLTARPGAYAVRFDRSDWRSLIFFGSLVLLVLAAACGNVGSLQLARAVNRDREMHLRASLGAGRWRIVRQLLTESFLIALLASAAGWALSFAAASYMLPVVGAPPWIRLSADWRVALCTFALALLATGLFGVAPALQAARRRTSRTRARTWMVGAQAASSCALLILSGLCVRSLNRVFTVDLGFEHKHVLSIDPKVEEHGFTPAAAAAALSDLKENLRRAPGVVTVSMCSIAPLGDSMWMQGVDEAQGIVSVANAVDPEFFAAMRIPIKRGRNFRPGERNAVIVSESLARRRWPGEDPIGKLYDKNERTIVVGVAGNARTIALRDGQSMEVYHSFPSDAAGVRGGSLLVRTEVGPSTAIPALRQILASRTRSVPRIDLLEDRFRQKTESSVKAAAVTGAAGGLALMMAAVGIAGLLSYTVSQRTKEIAIRVALGAKRSVVIRTVLGQVMSPVLGGVLCGTAAGAVLSAAIKRQLYGLSQFDPASYAGAIGTLAVAAGVAALLPARKALAVNPSDALRHE